MVRNSPVPLVSVVIPAYNGVSRYLEQAISSVLGQTVRDFELIVVDDASTDETAKLVQRFPRARYCRRAQNGGQAAARNDGARLATGSYLAFLDQDDLWEPTFLQETLAVLSKALDAAVVHCDGYQVSEQNEILEYDAAMKLTRSITQMLRGGHDVATSGSLFRKSCFDAVGGYDDQLWIWEDIDLAIRLYQRFPVVHLPRPLYRHRLYGHNVSRRIPSERALLGRQRFLEKHGPACKPSSPEARALARDWAHYYGDLGKYHLHNGRTGEARQAFRHALRSHPTPKGLLRFLRAYLTGSGTTRSTP
jgi:glycosyltransferase involved in cell wall biosynthesis